MTDSSLELNALFGPNWYAGKFLAVKVRCLPGFTRKRKVRGKGGTTVEKSDFTPARFTLEIEGVGTLWLYESEIESIVRLGQYAADDETQGRKARQRRNMAGVLDAEPPDDDADPTPAPQEEPTP